MNYIKYKLNKLFWFTCVPKRVNFDVSSSFERASTPGRTLTVLRQKFILLLPQAAAVLLGSDVDSDGVEPTLSFVFQTRQPSCLMQCPTYGAHY